MANLGRQFCLTRTDLRRLRTLTWCCQFAGPSTSRRSCSGWLPTIGLEIHAQLATRSKMFSGASTDCLLPVNSSVSFLDASLPGTLPVLNRRCVEAGVTAALALHSRINLVSEFDRKHYFYADMPMGYQITQQRRALANDGGIDYYVVDHYTQFKRRTVGAYRKRTRILQVQLEQDSGKSLHDPINNRTLIDLNRAGCGLIEIVTEPNMKDGNEAACLAMELLDTLVEIGVCDGHLDKGQFRVDANVSVSLPGQPLGTKVEIKNINSLRFVKLAIDHEIVRQVEILESGGMLMNETRGFDINTGRTLEMRDKEMRQDYRFMPEPNLLPLRLVDNDSSTTDAVNVAAIRRTLPSTLPFDQKQRWIEFGVSPDDVYFVLLDEDMGPYFKCCMKFLEVNAAAPLLTTWLIKECHRQQKKNKQKFTEMCRADHFTKLVEMVYTEELTTGAGHSVLTIMISEQCKRPPDKCMHDNNLVRISEKSAIAAILDAAFKAEPKLVEQYKKGKSRSEEKLISTIMRNYTKQIKREDIADYLSEHLQRDLR